MTPSPAIVNESAALTFADHSVPEPVTVGLLFVTVAVPVEYCDISVSLLSWPIGAGQQSYYPQKIPSDVKVFCAMLTLVPAAIPAVNMDPSLTIIS